MAKKALVSLGTMVRSKRGTKKLRETAKELGIGSATLMRIENGHVPDVHTFGKVCKWLNVDPGEFLGFERDVSIEAGGPIELSVHLRTDKIAKPETLNSLANMILLASKMQPSPSKPNG